MTAGVSATLPGKTVAVRWFTADLHLGHANIIRYCRRPFADVHAMDEALVDNWNAVVGPGDEVWVLGDFALGPIAETLPMAKLLEGRKVLVTGNHDRCWPGQRKRGPEWEARYRDASFDEVLHGTVEVDVGPHRVLAGHFPYRGDSQAHDRFTDMRPSDTGGWLLHGHVHDKWKVNGRQINVGVDVWDHRPVSEDEIAAVIDGATSGNGGDGGTV